MSSDVNRDKVVAVLQARMGSARLPGKILAEVAGVPLLELIVRRVRTARSIDRLIVATTHLPEDDRVVTLCNRLRIGCFRGAVDDCLDRIYRAAIDFRPEILVRLTGDNPAPDGEFVDWVIGEYAAASPPCAYVDTMSSSSFPYGLSVEVVSFDALVAAWNEATAPADREHVTRYIRQRPDRFSHRALRWERDEHGLRLTVDFAHDLERMDRLFRSAGRLDIGWRELVDLARVS